MPLARRAHFTPEEALAFFEELRRERALCEAALLSSMQSAPVDCVAAWTNPGERVIDGERLYSAAWLGDEAA
jgi:hypothetical protein